VALVRLSPASLAQAGANGTLPGYARATLRPRIVHLGIGAFMRAHLAAATEAAMLSTGQADWGIVGVSLRRSDTRDALKPQDGLYTLAVKELAGLQLQVIGAVAKVLVANEDPQAVLDYIAAPETAIVSLTVTEKGYTLVPGAWRLNQEHPDVEHDLINEKPRSAIGMLVRGLKLRYERGAGPLTCMSLDNLPSNGDTLKTVTLEFAALINPELAQWIAKECSFPNSMVDRIVPRTTDKDREQVSAALVLQDAWPVVAEAFTDWAVEDKFVAGRPAWEVARGVRFVPSAHPWETLKLRMVNGSHSAIAYLSVLAGWPTVDVAMAQPELRRFVSALLDEEISPTLPPLPGLDLDVYREQLLTRFANPALQHSTTQIAMDGSVKIPQRLLGTIEARLEQGLPVPKLALALAAWLHFLRGKSDAGVSYKIDDPMAAHLQELAQQASALAGPAERAAFWLRQNRVLEGLAKFPAFGETLGRALSSLEQFGAALALRQYCLKPI
jgi:fructuronate reductase